MHAMEREAPATARGTLRRDAAIVGGMTLLTAYLAGHYEWSEHLYTDTRTWEFMQVDEWPIALFVFAVTLSWVAWRRYGDAMRALRARELAEARLAAALTANRRLAHEHLRVQERERKHLARELHDELAQYSNAIKLDAIALRDAPHGDGAGIDAAGDRIVQSVDHMHTAVSDMIRRLRPAGLDELGLVAALEQAVARWRMRLPRTQISFVAAGDFADVGELATLTIYRFVQEALTNCSKHAAATQIDITLDRGAHVRDTAHEIHVEVRDDGHGADPRIPVQGFGLSGMRERVTLMGGELQIDTSPGKGFRLSAQLPSSGHE